MKFFAHAALFSAALLAFAGCSQTPDKNSSQAAKKDTAQTVKKDTTQAKSDSKPTVDPFIKFKRNSIKAEAGTNLKAIAEGAIAWFDTEHPTDESYTSSFTKRYPISKTQSQLGPEVGEKTIGKTHRISPDEYKQSPDAFGRGVWEQLRFELNTETYYTYYYISDGSSFTVKASASIEKPCDSIYKLTGFTRSDNAFVHQIIDLSDDPDAIYECNTVKLY